MKPITDQNMIRSFPLYSYLEPPNIIHTTYNQQLTETWVISSKLTVTEHSHFHIHNTYNQISLQSQISTIIKPTVNEITDFQKHLWQYLTDAIKSTQDQNNPSHFLIPGV